MGFASTYLQEHTGAVVHFRDSIALREGNSVFFTEIYKEHYDYIFLETSTPSWDTLDKEIVREINRLCPYTKIVICGTIAVSRGEEILSNHPVHACIKGEYEKGSVRVVQDKESGLIDFDMLTREEMNHQPNPYFSKEYLYRYFDPNPQGIKLPCLQAWSSRGCWAKCVFCSWPATMTGNDPDGTTTRKVRYYDYPWMLSYLKKMVSEYRFNSVYFDDDIFNAGDAHVLEMCKVMREIKVPWSAMCRADRIDRSTWKEMKDSGCYGVKVGIESGNQWVLDNIVNKQLNLKEAKETIQYLKGIGMSVHGTFTYGLPGETKEQMFDTRRFVKELLAIGMDTYQESGTALIEGTPMDTLVQLGTLKKYPGARGEGYEGMADGNKKMSKLASQLVED
jgi:radical SAM superfamily enzyme YgiQ (UPF0313 family)